MKGIRFEIINERNNYIYKIFKGIKFDDFDWYIYNDDVYYEKGDLYFDSSKYKEKNFEKKIKNEIYYIVHINIQAYLKNKDIEKDRIVNCDEFLESNCEIMLSIIDCKFVEVYTRNGELLNIINKNAIENEFVDIKYIL